MNILHLSTTDGRGGSGQSARRIHEGLRRLGHSSEMVVGLKEFNDPFVKSVSDGLLKKTDRGFRGILNRSGFNDLFYPSSYFLYFREFFKKSDLLQIYNLHANYFSFSALPLLNFNKPVVLRLSDMYPFTGHCGYSYDCLKWKTGCFDCAYLSEYPSLEADRTSTLWKAKKLVFRSCKKLIIVAPSRWIRQCAEESPFFAGCRTELIPNGIDLSLFTPSNKTAMKKKFRIPLDKTALLFVAEDFAGDKRKGGKYLLEALLKLDKKTLNTLVLILMGNSSEVSETFPFEIIRTGYLNDRKEIAALYSAADLMALPTLADNLPNTILESLACGTPVVAFDTGGVKDGVIHMKTGYLATLKKSGEFAEGLSLLIKNRELLSAFSENGLEFARKNFDEKREINSFMELYKDILKKGRGYSG